MLRNISFISIPTIFILSAINPIIAGYYLAFIGFAIAAIALPFLLAGLYKMLSLLFVSIPVYLFYKITEVCIPSVAASKKAALDRLSKGY